MPANGSIQAEVQRLAIEAGFSAAGLVPLPAPGADTDGERMRQFASNGHAGEMHYLLQRDEQGRLLRESIQVPFPWARSVLVCAASYHSSQPSSLAPAAKGSGWIARYAWSGRREKDGSIRPSDYHKILLKRLKSIETKLHEVWGDFQSRCFVDTGPVIERAFARYAGLGWTGKNTCLIHPKLGSWLFLGVLLTSYEVPAETRLTVVPDRCGTCRRCIEACPTNALYEPYKMDASRCIAYLTIEKRSTIQEDLRQQVGRQIFGCDICQDVCPWNRKAPITQDEGLIPREELVNPSLAWLADLSEEGFNQLFNGSPVRRTRFEGMRRNVALAMGNSKLTRYVPWLQQWAQQDDDKTLKEIAAWSLLQLTRQNCAASNCEQDSER